MQAINDLVERVFMIVAGVLFAIFIATIFYQVLARNYLSISVNWTDEVALLCFVWSVFLGAAVAVRRRAHYVVELLPEGFITANNALRVNGADLRCKVVGEGGNLGLTQLGRIEYSRFGCGGRGGRINTDFIDNSAGVDTSDHEVNIKILLDRVVADGDLTGKQRDELLEAMTDEEMRQHPALVKELRQAPHP
jgi:hypothetical protein